MKANILVVDDDSAILDLMEAAFLQAGYRVDKAGDILTAERMLQANDYDVLIADKNITASDGSEEGGMSLLQGIKKRGSKTEVIIVTGYATIETAIEAMRLGAFDYLLKPFRLEVLKGKVERVLEFRKFLNPDNTIQSFKDFHNELLNLFENRDREINPKIDSTIQSMLTKVEHFFRVQKERERIMIAQREALAQIAGYAEELREKLLKSVDVDPLLDKICDISIRRF